MSWVNRIVGFYCFAGSCLAVSGSPSVILSEGKDLARQQARFFAMLRMT